MADFCLRCFNEMNDTQYSRGDVIQEYGICEGCGQYRKCVVGLRGHSPIDWLVRILLDLTSRDIDE